MGLIWITNANYLKDYKIELEFNNNKKGVFDFENHLHTKLFLPLKELETFKKFKPIIFTEMLRKWAAKFGYHPNDIINYFSNFGYNCFQ